MFADPVISVHICRIVKCVVLLLLLPGLSSIYMLTRGSSSMITATTMMITMIYFCQDLDLCAISQKNYVYLYIFSAIKLCSRHSSSVMMIMIISLTMLQKKIENGGNGHIDIFILEDHIKYRISSWRPAPSLPTFAQ